MNSQEVEKHSSSVKTGRVSSGDSKCSASEISMSSSAIHSGSSSSSTNAKTSSFFKEITFLAFLMRDFLAFCKGEWFFNSV